jgi:hypothetical protein
LLRKKEIHTIIKPSTKELIFYNSWQIKREQPLWKFILLNGVLREAIALFTLVKIFQYLVDRSAFVHFYTTVQGIFFLIFEILFWTFSGFVIGWFKFNSKEIEFELLKGLLE